MSLIAHSFARSSTGVTAMWLMLAAAVASSWSSVHAASSPLDRAYYPQFHVRPEKNWINDPNGPFYDPRHKKYHLWMQYNPYAAHWGNMSWFHLVSDDLVYWRRLDVTLYNGDEAADANGVFSGAVTVRDDGGLVMSYTCVNASWAQKQCAAVPVDRDDPDLIEWRRVDGNPLLHEGPYEPRGTDNFRDPGVGWKTSGGKYRQIVATSYEPNVAAVALYDSADLTKGLEFAGILLESTTQLRLMFECPDYFPLSDLTGGDDARGMAVFKQSDMGPHQDVWYLGFNDVDAATGSQTWSAACPDASSGSLKRCDIDGEPGSFVGGALDYGLFYAAISFWDTAKRRRVLWAWLDDEYDRYPSGRDWRGVQSIPRVLRYDKALRHLVTPPIPEMVALRREWLALPSNGEGGGAVTYPLPVPTEIVAPTVTNTLKSLRSNRSAAPMVMLTRRAGGASPHERRPPGFAAQHPAAMLFGAATLATTELPQYEAVAVISVDRQVFDAAGRIEVGLDILIDDWAPPVVKRRRAEDDEDDYSADEESATNGNNDVGPSRRTFVGIFVDRRMTHMKAKHIPGGDYRHMSTQGIGGKKNRTAREQFCAATCDRDIRCIAWSHDDAIERCFLKSRIVASSPNRVLSTTTSGVLDRPMFGVWRGRSGTDGHAFPQFGRVVHLNKTADGSRYVFELRVFVDRSVVEAFKDGGLERIATHVYNHRATSLVAPACRVTATKPSGGSAVPAAGVVTVESFDAWRVGSVWETPSVSDAFQRPPAGDRDASGTTTPNPVPPPTVSKRALRPHRTPAPSSPARKRRRVPSPEELADAHQQGFGELDHGSQRHTPHPDPWRRATTATRAAAPEGTMTATAVSTFVATTILWWTVAFLCRCRRAGGGGSGSAGSGAGQRGYHRAPGSPRV